MAKRLCAVNSSSRQLQMDSDPSRRSPRRKRRLAILNSLATTNEKMTQAAYLRKQIIKLTPAGVDKNLGDPQSGSDRIWYRVPVPSLRRLLKTWKSQSLEKLDFDAWQQTLDDLYDGKSIDERTFAGMILAACDAFRSDVSLEQLDSWLGRLDGWKEVDNTCQSGYTADDLLSDWKSWQRFLRRLSKSKNMNKRRASLVLLVKPLRSNDEPRFLDLAFELVEDLKHEDHKLITKAISWVLRSATKHHAAAVQQFLECQRDSLPAIAVRETQRKLVTGKK